MAADTMSIAEVTPHIGLELATEPPEALGAAACSTDQGRTGKDREEGRSKNDNHWTLFGLYCPPGRTDSSFSEIHRKPCRQSQSPRQVSHRPPSASVRIFAKPEPHSAMNKSAKILLLLPGSDETRDVVCEAWDRKFEKAKVSGQGTMR